MTQMVWTTETRDTTFHGTPDCKPLRHGQDQWDADCWDDVCTHRHPRPRRIREMPLTEALGKRKWPCAYCYPGSAAALMISPCEEDFGHEPYHYDGAVICMRCYTVAKGRHEVVYWPCTSAIVYGLVPRALVVTE